MKKTSIKPGQKIIQPSFPEYGTFTILRCYQSNCEGSIWEVRGEAGDAAICDYELIKFYQEIN